MASIAYGFKEIQGNFQTYWKIQISAKSFWQASLANGLFAEEQLTSREGSKPSLSALTIGNYSPLKPLPDRIRDLCL
jgi:hypothetical protein